MVSRQDALALDDADVLAGLRDLFVLPDDLIYLDGNSLGAQSVRAADTADEVIAEWREQLIGGWQGAGWWDLPVTAGRKIAGIIGADPDAVVVCDTTTVNLFKTVNTALDLRPDRRVIVIDEGGFPTDQYVVDGIAERRGLEVRVVPTGTPIEEEVDDSVAVAVLGHVDFRTAELLDMAAITATLHGSGSLVVWDLSHSAGVVPMDLSSVDFAVGCTYKYLNGGPGAPAYVYVHPRHQGAEQPIPGWLGHAEPFEMASRYEPAPSIRRYLTGTQPILSMRLLDAALHVYEAADVEAIRAKSSRLTDLFIRLVDERCDGLGLGVIGPREPSRRGSQVSLRHANAVPIFEELVGLGVRGDFRRPDILRFGLAPLYVSFVDVWDAVDALRSAVGARM